MSKEIQKKWEKLAALSALIVEQHTGEKQPLPPKLEKLKNKEHKRILKEIKAERKRNFHLKAIGVA